MIADHSFRQVVGQVELLLRKDSELDGPLPGVPQARYVRLSGCYRQAAIVLMVAVYEAFLRELMEEYVQLVNTKVPRALWNTLPNRLRDTHVFGPYVPNKKNILPGETDIAFRLRVMNELAGIVANIASPGSNPLAYVVEVSGFLLTNNNPDADQTKDMMARIGCEKVFENARLVRTVRRVRPDLPSGDSMKNELDRIVRRRHWVAHGRWGPVAGVTRMELSDSVRFLKSFTRQLRRLADESFAKL